MFRRRLVRLLLLGLGGGLAFYVVKVLRGDPAPVFSGTPTGPRPPRTPPTPAPSVTPSVAPSPPWIDAEGTDRRHAPGQGQAQERHLPPARDAQLRPHRPRPLVPRRRGRRGRRPQQGQALTSPTGQRLRTWTPVTPSAARSWSCTSAGTGSVVDDHHERGVAVGRPADVHVGDVDAGVAEDRADPADDAGAVVVAHDQHVAGRRHVDRVVVDRHDAGLAVEPDERAGDRVVAARRA